MIKLIYIMLMVAVCAQLFGMESETQYLTFFGILIAQETNYKPRGGIKQEKEGTSFGDLPFEVKEKLMLLLAKGLLDKNYYLNDIIKELKEKTKIDSDMKEILDEDKFFTEKVLRLLHKKYMCDSAWRTAIFLLVAVWDTNAAWQILKRDYEKNNKLFFYLFTLNFTKDLSKLFVWPAYFEFEDLMKVFERIFTLEDKVQFFKCNFDSGSHTILTLYLIMTRRLPSEIAGVPDINVIKSILDKANKTLTLVEKRKFLTKKVNCRYDKEPVNALQLAQKLKKEDFKWKHLYFYNNVIDLLKNEYEQFS